MHMDLERHASRSPRRDSHAPIVPIHGGGGDRRTWAPVVHGPTAESEVVVVDLPGFGASRALPAHVEPTPVGFRPYPTGERRRRAIRSAERWAVLTPMVSPDGAFEHVIQEAGHMPTYEQTDRTVYVLLATTDTGTQPAEAA